MSVPSEILKHLHGRTAQAHAMLSCSLRGPIGETHLVVADGQLFVFTRESIVGDFEQVELAGKPGLEKGDFNDTLRMTIADGTDAELNVTGFEREAVVIALAASSAPARTQAVAAPPEPTKQATPPPAKPSAAVQAPKPNESESVPPQDDEPDDQADAEIAIYHGSDIGAVGCSLQFLLVAGAIVGMWYAQVVAMGNLGINDTSESDIDTLIFIVTKAVAIIGGFYIGAKLARTVTRVARMRNWPGRVVIDAETMRIVGPQNTWQSLFERDQPTDINLSTYTPSEASSDSKGKPVKRQFQLYMQIKQGDKRVVVKTAQFAEAPTQSINGRSVELRNAALEHEFTLATDESTFRKIAARLR